MREFNPRQDEAEFDQFVQILRRNRVKSYLEIGSRFGGSLWWVASSLPKNSLLVSVDMPSDDDARNSLGKCVEKIRNELDHIVISIVGNSQSEQVVSFAKSWAPFDALFIDGDHSFEGVSLDFINYSPMAKIVALHDIGPSNIEGIDVPKFWDQFKSQARMNILNEGSIKGIGILGHW